MSQVNGLIVRVRDRDELFQGACRIAVESGGFLLRGSGAWIVVGASVVPVASAGNCPAAALPVERGFPLDDLAQPCTLTVHTREAVIVNDLASDVRFMRPGIEPANGILSLVSLPIIVGGEVVAVMSLHASDVDYFDDAEIALLTEVANNIGFAIDHIGSRKHHTWLLRSIERMATQLFLERRSNHARHDAGCCAGRPRALQGTTTVRLHAARPLRRRTWLAGSWAIDPIARVGPTTSLRVTEGDRPRRRTGRGRLIKRKRECIPDRWAPFRSRQMRPRHVPGGFRDRGRTAAVCRVGAQERQGRRKRIVLHPKHRLDARQLVRRTSSTCAEIGVVLHYKPKVNGTAAGCRAEASSEGKTRAP